MTRARDLHDPWSGRELPLCPSRRHDSPGCAAPGRHEADDMDSIFVAAYGQCHRRPHRHHERSRPDEGLPAPHEEIIAGVSGVFGQIPLNDVSQAAVSVLDGVVTLGGAPDSEI